MLNDKLLAAKNLVETEQFTEALTLLEEILEQDNHNAAALNMMGFCWLSVDREATALTMFKSAHQLEPNNPYILLNLGRAYHEMGKHPEALGYFLKAAEIKPDYELAYANGAAALVQMSNWADGKKCCEMALECDPEESNSLMNIANCELGLGNLKDGWAYMERSLGSKYRKEWAYGDESRWNGEKDQTIVVYGEQGLGDEIYFCESLPDAIKASKEVHVDCDPRLARLFSRSFPVAIVHGTRRDDAVTWLEGLTIDARCAMGSLPRFFRQSSDDYPRQPYLTPDPEKALMWRSLFDSYKKPVIGICTRSGSKKNNEAGRTLTSSDFDALRAKYDAVFVSLDYKGDDMPWAKAFHFATRSNDYDDTAALVSQLDAVVGVCTTATHLSEALGVQTKTLIPKWHNFKFAGGIPPIEGTEYVHQGNKTWAETIAGIELDL